MTEIVMYAKYNQAGNREIYSLLDKMSVEDWEKDRGSYYGSLSGLLRHAIGGTYFFLSMLKSALAGNAAALKAIDSMPPPRAVRRYIERSGMEGTWQNAGSGGCRLYRPGRSPE